MNLLRRGIIQSGGGGALNIADVFGVDLWTGNDSNRTITSGLDYVANEGLVWLKNRTTAFDNYLFDSVRGANKYLRSNNTGAEVSNTTILTAFNADGYDIGTNAVANGGGTNVVGWSFIKAAKFFDIVKYTGDGVAGRAVPIDLAGADFGMAIVKSTNISNSWLVQHRSLGGSQHLILDTNASAFIGSTQWDSTAGTSATLTLGANIQVNANLEPYVAYIFAHDTSADGVIQCGQYTGDGSSANDIELGWKPQYVMIKRTTVSTGNWIIFDTARGISEIGGGGENNLYANLSNAEAFGDVIDLTPTGFRIKGAQNDSNISGSEYVYMAIREETV